MEADCLNCLSSGNNEYRDCMRCMSPPMSSSSRGCPALYRWRPLIALALTLEARRGVKELRKAVESPRVPSDADAGSSAAGISSVWLEDAELELSESELSCHAR